MSLRERLLDFDAAQGISSHGERLRRVVRAAAALREVLLDEPPVTAVRTLPLTPLPYPTEFALQGAARSPVPFVNLVHRALLVQFGAPAERKTLLFNPSDVEANRATPFFRDLIDRLGPLVSALAPKMPSLEQQLTELGLAPDDVDLLAFDHFHTQDLRRLVGTSTGTAARFPRATLLAPRNEWHDWGDAHPMQRVWYVHDGKSALREDRVRFTEGSVHVGPGVVLLWTPGHTSGNQTLLLRTESGLWGCSENGTSADNWSPRASRIAGVARMARRHDLDVLINSNTPELGAGQYTSMMAEKTIVDRVAEGSDFFQMFPSSELTSAFWTLGLGPTHVHGGIQSGAVAVPGAQRHVA